MEVPALQYDPLTDPDSFRLIVLLPGGRQDDIHCQIFHTRHGSSVDYEALSYTWGTPENPEICYLNGQATMIQHNLYEALLHLRSSWEPRTLWIDAICIDQSNISERNHQVGQMRSIYSQADSVIVWLGTESRTSGTAMQWIEDSSLQNRSSLGIRERLDLTSPERIIQKQTKRWLALRHLCKRAYWSRVWIVQEVVLAKRIKLQCGDSEVKWEGLENILNSMTQLYTPKRALIAMRMVRSSLPARLHELRTMHMNHGCTLSTLLQTTRNSLCSDPRDKVYALLGLSADCRHGKMVVDYSKGMEDIYTSLWKFYVGNNSPKMVMHGSHLLERLSSGSNLSGLADMCLPQTVLDVVGSVEGTILYVGQPWADQESAEAWYRELGKLLTMPDENATVPVERNYQRFCSALCQTTAADAARVGVPEESAASQENRQYLQPVDRPVSRDGKLDMSFQAFDLSNSSFWEREGDKNAEYKSHHVFIGTRGQFGIAPQGSVVGDEICQFQGSDVTIIVRRQKSLEDVGNQTEFIGKALLARAGDSKVTLASAGMEALYEPGLTAILGKMSRVPVRNDSQVCLKLSSVTLRWLTRESS